MKGITMRKSKKGKRVRSDVASFTNPENSVH